MQENISSLKFKFEFYKAAPVNLIRSILQCYYLPFLFKKIFLI